MNKVSIKTRITFWYISLMIILIVFFLGVIFYISENLIINSEHNNLKNTVNTAFEKIVMNNGELEIDRDMDILLNNVYLSVFDEDKEFVYGNVPSNFSLERVLSSKGGENMEEMMYGQFSDNGKVKIIKSRNNKWYLYDSKKNYGEYGDIWIRGIMPASEAEKAIELIVLISLTAFPIIIFFIALIGYVVTRNAFKPIEKIRLAAEKINEGDDLSERINMQEGYDEIYTLAETFDTMFDRLQKSFEREVQFTSDVSHELRTPISVIISQSEHGLEHMESIERTEKSFKIILEESRKMSKLISQLLTLSRMDRGHQKMNVEEVNISELVQVVIENQEGEANNKGITIISEIERDIYIEGDELMLMRLFISLISNAIAYNKEGGHVKVEIKKNKDKIVGKVSDNGIGISQENIEKIWTRFYQVDPSRTSDSSGLGLAMVKWIIAAHEGVISVVSRLGEGTLFTLELPYSSNKKDKKRS